MTWNYRVVKDKDGDEDYFRIHEVYYDDEGNIKMYSKDPIDAAGESIEELKKDLTLMLQALDKPALELKELEVMFPH